MDLYHTFSCGISLSFFFHMIGKIASFIGWKSWPRPNIAFVLPASRLGNRDFARWDHI
jgi:hypothetical protein